MRFGRRGECTAMENNEHFFDFLPIGSIVCRLGVITRDALLQKMLEMVKRQYEELDLDLAADEIAERERVFPTVIAPGLAVPHARIPGLPRPLAALATVPSGVDFGSSMGDAQVVLLVLSPMEDPNLHLRIFSELAARFGDPTLVPALAACTGPQAVMDILSGNSRSAMPDYLKAGDIMTTPNATLLETDSLSHAIRTFAVTGISELVVLDASGDLRGVIDLADILRYCLPEHLLWMEDLAPIYLFQPFSELLRSAGETKVADVMREEFLTVDRGVPAIQLAKLFMNHRVKQLIITDGRHFAGVVEFKAFCAKLFWE